MPIKIKYIKLYSIISLIYFFTLLGKNKIYIAINIAIILEKIVFKLFLFMKIIQEYTVEIITVSTKFIFLHLSFENLTVKIYKNEFMNKFSIITISIYCSNYIHHKNYNKFFS